MDCGAISKRTLRIVIVLVGVFTRIDSNVQLSVPFGYRHQGTEVLVVLMPSNSDKE